MDENIYKIIERIKADFYVYNKKNAIFAPRLKK